MKFLVSIAITLTAFFMFCTFQVSAAEATEVAEEIQIEEENYVALEENGYCLDTEEDVIYIKYDYLELLKSKTGLSEELLTHIVAETTDNNIPLSYFLAMAEKESTFNTNLVGRYVGMMQVSTDHIANARSMGLNIYDPYDNVSYACYLLRAYMDEHGLNLYNGIAAYNGGPYNKSAGYVYASKVEVMKEKYEPITL